MDASPERLTIEEQAREEMTRRDDHYGWLTATARALRVGDVALVDHTALAEELESLGSSERRELQSRITQILEHLLKLNFTQGMILDYNHRLWRGSITRQQVDIDSLLRDSPSLKPLLTKQLIAEAYNNAAKIVSEEYGITPPATCPFTLSEMLGERG